MSEESLDKPGGVQCDDLTLITHSGEKFVLKADIPAGHEGYVAEVNIFEDMFNKFVTGDIVIRDASNMMEKGPIVGGETLTMTYRTNTFPGDMQHTIQRSFKITGIYNRTLNNDREQFYQLQFVSEEAYKDQTTILKKRFEGLTHEIILKIYDEYLKAGRPGLPGQVSDGLFINDIPHISKINFVANQWTPMQAYDYLARYCATGELEGSDFLFYESHKSFYFTTMQKRIKEQKDNMFEEYIYEMGGAKYEHRSAGNYRAIKLPKNYITIDKFVVPRTMDTIDGQDNGYYAQQGRAYDLHSKERIKVEMDVNKDFPRFVHTEDKCPIPQQIPREKLSKTTFKMLQGMNNMREANNVPGGAYGNNDLDNVPANQLYRDNYFSSFKDYTFECHVPGRTDIQCGDLIQIMYPSTNSKGEGTTYDDIFDKKLTGKYLITAIRHKIDTVGHTMIMEVVKNGLPVPPV